MSAEPEYQVVVNQEEQYSIWPADRLPLPDGWRAAGVQASKERCLEHIRRVWTDQRPLSLRRDGAAQSGRPPAEAGEK